LCLEFFANVALAVVATTVVVAASAEIVPPYAVAFVCVPADAPTLTGIRTVAVAVAVVVGVAVAVEAVALALEVGRGRGRRIGRRRKGTSAAATPAPCMALAYRPRSRLNRMKCAVAVAAVAWSGMVYYRGRATLLRMRSWRGAFTTSPTVLNSQPGRALNAEVTAQRTWAFSPHSTLVVLTCCSRSRSLALFCLSVRARGCGRRGAVRRAVLPVASERL
jgi:hypothetical protein